MKYTLQFVLQVKNTKLSKSSRENFRPHICFYELL